MRGVKAPSGVNMGNVLLIRTFLAKRIEAEDMAAALLEQRLAACAQVSGPVWSSYRWKGELQREEEYMLSVKTLEEHYSKLVAFINERHSYEVPEIIAVPVHAVNEAYLDWVREQCT